MVNAVPSQLRIAHGVLQEKQPAQCYADLIASKYQKKEQGKKSRKASRCNTANTAGGMFRRKNPLLMNMDSTCDLRDEAGPSDTFDEKDSFVESMTHSERQMYLSKDDKQPLVNINININLPGSPGNQFVHKKRNGG